MSNNQKIVISLGGSLIMPDGIDVNFLRAFKTLIEEEIGKGKSFVIITGGGKVCRRYQDAARELGVSDQDGLDWVGIYATRLNATLLRVVFGKDTYSEIIVEPENIPNLLIPIMVGGGGVPGHSSDFDAVQIAQTVGAKKIINLSNIDYAYDKDPRKFPDAKKIERSNWQEFRKILPAEWTPGVNAPFDPIAAKRAEELGIEVAIMNGANLENLRSYLNDESFQGTVISG